MNWRRWSGFDNLLERLKSRTGTTILLGKQDNHEPITGVCDLVNKLSVKQLVAVINSLDVLVSCDSGPMHIGFAVGTATVAIFGPVPPRFRMPLVGSDRHCVIYHSYAGKNEHTGIKERCPLKTGGFDDINVDEVYEKVLEKLRSTNINSS